MPEKEEKPTSGETVRPGYSYSASFGQQSNQFVRVKVEIKGQVKVVAVCALCHKAFRLCSLDPSVATDEELAAAKYLGLADGGEQDSANKNDSKDATKTDSGENLAEKSLSDKQKGQGNKDDKEKSLSEKGNKESSDSKDSKDSKDGKKSTDSGSGSGSGSGGSGSGSGSGGSGSGSGSSDEEKKKKKQWDNDHKRKTLPQTSWHTNKPSHDEWEKKKKKDY